MPSARQLRRVVALLLTAFLVSTGLWVVHLSAGEPVGIPPVPKLVRGADGSDRGAPSPPVDAHMAPSVRSLYKGCFADAFGPRDLPTLTKLFTVTPQRCANACHSKGFKFAGLQAGVECWCGDEYGRFGRSEACTDACLFDSSAVCGGKLANSVYAAAPFSHQTSVRDDPATDFPDTHINMCELENVYYISLFRQFVVHRGPTSRITGLVLGPNENLESFIEANTVEHIFKVTALSTNDMVEFCSRPNRGPPLRQLVPGASFMLMRFLPYNIMHVLHDDLLGLYYSMQRIANQSGIADGSFPLNSTVFLADEHSAGGYIEFATAFSDMPLLHSSELPENGVVRFERLSMGLLRRANWYHYGFFSHQGPIPNKHVNGADVRRVADFIAHRMGLPAPAAEPDTIVIFSRRGNRLILNEDALQAGLQARFANRVVFARLEDMLLRDVVALVRHASAVIGMHGSLLILAMFLPRGARVLELFPHGVPPENYTPYRTLAGLSGMELQYRAWRNTQRSNTVGHPHRPRLLGGLDHLNEAERERIIQLETVPTHKCCEDPVWLYKIYQDTKVDIDEVARLLDEMGEKRAR